MNQTINHINGTEKAAILLTSLAPETSAKVMEYLSQEERSRLAVDIRAVQKVSSISRRLVIDEVTKHVRAAKHSRELGQGASQNRKPLLWMEALDPILVAQALNRERPQSAATVLSELSPQCSANILNLLNERLRNQVVMRLATLKPVSEKALLAIDEAMRAKIFSSGEESIDEETRKKPLSKIIEIAAEQIKIGISPDPGLEHSTKIVKSLSKYTTLDQMLELSDAQMFEVLARVRMDDLAAVLKIAHSDLKSKILRNVSPDSAKILKKSINSETQLTLGELEEANNRVLDVLNKWSTAFEIDNTTAA